MNVLVCGAEGFVGRHIVAALRERGHQPLLGTRRAPADPRHHVQIDFEDDTDPQTWRNRLIGVDAVINAVGVLRDSRRHPMSLIHERGPIGLFDACARYGPRIVVHVSALGLAGSCTRYAQTKRAADEHLLRLRAEGQLSATVLQPSIVYGPGGASARMFDALSRWPILPLPRDVQSCQVQPLHVSDLAQLACRAVEGKGANAGVVPVVGPRPMPLVDFIGELRARRGQPAARIVSLPSLLVRWSVWMGDAMPITPWGREAFALLQNDSVGDPRVAATLLEWPMHEPLQCAA